MVEETKRDKVINIPVSDEELLMAKQAADELGMPMTTFIRLLIKNWANGVTFSKKG